MTGTPAGTIGQCQAGIAKARQGVRYLALKRDVVDPQTMEPVPRDGETIGSGIRGNVVMKGYFKNESASQAAFAGGWFHSGDLGVVHADNYVVKPVKRYHHLRWREYLVDRG